MRSPILKSLIITSALALSALGVSDASARIFVGGGVVVGAPYYYYPPYYGYYAPYYAYPPAPYPYPPAYGAAQPPAYPYPLPPPSAQDRYYQDNGGQNCREYRHSVVIDGEPREVTGHACRQPDGSWRIAD